MQASPPPLPLSVHTCVTGFQPDGLSCSLLCTAFREVFLLPWAYLDASSSPGYIFQA